MDTVAYKHLKVNANDYPDSGSFLDFFLLETFLGSSGLAADGSLMT